MRRAEQRYSRYYCSIVLDTEWVSIRGVAFGCRPKLQAWEWRAVRRLSGATLFRRCGVVVPTSAPLRAAGTNGGGGMLRAWRKRPNYSGCAFLLQTIFLASGAAGKQPPQTAAAADETGVGALDALARMLSGTLFILMPVAVPTPWLARHPKSWAALLLDDASTHWPPACCCY
ncbi:hypothetical protein QC762_503010 [Podospora pseudocomata]|uniref:Uncharacterized protein n=1 Tax=Podospora pseudocomata TaxID=2093779 RepID=A0ABR0G9M0_9PEZI|nr:hypothetical protein QC762_503010 [Podospora pseudocomata]